MSRILFPYQKSSSLDVWEHLKDQGPPAVMDDGRNPAPIGAWDSEASPQGDELSESVSGLLLSRERKGPGRWEIVTVKVRFLFSLRVYGENKKICDPMDCTLPGSSVHGILPEFCHKICQKQCSSEKPSRMATWREILPDTKHPTLHWLLGLKAAQNCTANLLVRSPEFYQPNTWDDGSTPKFLAFVLCPQDLFCLLQPWVIGVHLWLKYGNWKSSSRTVPKGSQLEETPAAPRNKKTRTLENSDSWRIFARGNFMHIKLISYLRGKKVLILSHLSNTHHTWRYHAWLKNKIWCPSSQAVGDAVLTSQNHCSEKPGEACSSVMGESREA